MEYIVKGKSLRRDISEIRRLKKANFTQKTYYRQEEILDRADDILRHYRQNELKIDAKDYPALAEYINQFGMHHKDEMLDKLQAVVNFDVRIYLEDKSKTLWQRLFPKKDKPTLTGAQMKSAMKKFSLMSHKASHDLFNNPHLTVKIEKLQSEAEQNVEAFLNNKLDIAKEDLDTFKQYLKVFNASIYEGSPAKKAIAKIEELKQADGVQPSSTNEPKPATIRKPIISSYGFKRPAANIWTRLGNRLKSLWSAHKPTTAKIRFLNTPAPTLWRRLKVAAVTGLVIVAGAFGLKSGEGTHAQNTTDSKNKTTLPIDNIAQNTDNSKTLTAVQFQNIQKAQNVQEKQAVKKVEKQADKQADKDARIWQNYYDTTIDIVAPTVHVNKQELYNKIQNQLDKGILTLPENVTKEKVALNYVLFKAYGLQSSLENALNTDKQLSAQQQAEFTRDAGVKQADIKQIALKKYGKLSSYSSYDHASNKLKKQHASNLKELRQMKKQAAQHI